MASMQKSHEERAQSAAQKAADELHAARREQVGDEAPVSPRGGGGGGILGSVRESARSVMGKAGETKDAAADRARGAMDAAADKGRGVRDAAADMTTDDKEGDDDESEDVMLRVKGADQMTGQTFNDVGKMGGEGTGIPGRRRSS